MSRTKKRNTSHLLKNRHGNKAALENEETIDPPEETITVPVKTNLQHCIINFYTVFGALSNFVVCKTCKSKVKFNIIEPKGLGFKIEVQCDCDPTVKIPSSEYDNRTYDINKRFLFVMKVLGIGVAGCRKFCALMDMAPLFQGSTYTIIMNSVNEAVKKITESCLKQTEKAFDFVADVAACQLREGNKVYLAMLHAIGVEVGESAAQYVGDADEERAKKAPKRREYKRRKREENKAAGGQGSLANEGESTDEEMPDQD